ncbi:hypothetical protein PIB30_069208 [Stylosanthes scabra]|uniref:Putative plant transposon protein domain-containing protein n=1 Tax=Stylosanthes scabra TaxID=79078 RepID=A0ABU6TQB6_9FABA|nr:hypothetical protein [Stylosanthes scabra]
MEDLSMFQKPRTVALEYEKPETYGMVLIYPLYHLVECGFAGNPGLTLLRYLGREPHQNGAVTGELNMCAGFGLENRDIVHERIVRLDDDENRIFQERLLGLGWGFMYDDLVRINVTVVGEFCANFSSAKQAHVFLRGKKIPFTEADIHSHLNIPGDAPDADVDDAFVTFVKTYATGGDLNMEAIYAVIGRDDTNWVDNSTINLIPKNMNNSILNPPATAWHKIIMANIDPKTHGTKFDMKHALLIYVLMAEGVIRSDLGKCTESYK